MRVVKVRVCETYLFHNVFKLLFLKNMLQDYLQFFLVMRGPLSSQNCKSLFLKNILEDTFLFLFLLSYFEMSSQIAIFSAKNFARFIPVSSFPYYVLFRRRILQGYLSSLLAYCHSQYGTILFLNSILQNYFCFFFLLYCVVQPSIKERLRHHSPTPPDNGCNTDISN